METNYNLVEIANLIRNSTNACGSVRVIAIDGPAGSGKTTLAQLLAAQIDGAPIVHMDNVYDGWQQDLIFDLPEKLETQILKPLKVGAPVSYQKYDWHQSAFTNSVDLPPSNFLILEGVGAANPKLSDYLALAIWIEADSSVRLDRVLARDGIQIKDEVIAFQAKEARYFEHLNVQESCDLHLTGD